MLADEPTGNLDEGSAEAVLELMLELVREAGAALLVVTHSEAVASRMGARAHLRAGKVDGQGVDAGHADRSADDPPRGGSPRPSPPASPPRDRRRVIGAT